MKPTWQSRSWHVAHNFRSFLRSNRYPLDSELTAIKERHCQCPITAGAYPESSQWHHWRRRRRNCVKKRRIIEAFVVIHKGFISAIRRFPREILCEIFCHILDMCSMVAPPNGEALNIFSHRRYPWVLGRVLQRMENWFPLDCRHSGVALNLQNHMILLSRNPEKMLTTCLERSGKHSLEIVIALQDYGMSLPMLVSVQGLSSSSSHRSHSAGSPLHSLMAHDPAYGPLWVV